MPSTTHAAELSSETGAHPHVPQLRWIICGILFFAAVINYVDRGTISILSHHVQKTFHMTESDYGWIIFSFQISYGLMFLAFGRIIDRVGTRWGFALALTWWSFAAMGQSLAGGVATFALASGLLAMGEAGSFPGSLKAVAEWFPKGERALATGVFNCGTALGAVVTYPLVGWLFLHWGWQLAFVSTGALGLICVPVWLLLYRRPQDHPWLGAKELQHIEVDADEPQVREVPRAWTKIVRYRQAWSFALAKGLTDPVWWFYVFWLPKYLLEARHLSMHNLQLFGYVPFLAAVPGSLTGGWLAGRLLRTGHSVTFTRKVSMLVFALLMPVASLAVICSKPWMALLCISMGTAGHQGWSANLFTLPSDMFPKCEVATVVGMGGAAGAFGGAILAWVAGHVLLHHTYLPLFIGAGIMHPLTLLLLQFVAPKIEKVPAA